VGAVTVAMMAWRLGWPALLDGGARLRARHRWAVAEIAADGHARLCKWRPTDARRALSPLEAGGPAGVRVRADGDGPSLVTVELGGGDLRAGTYQLGLRLEALGTAAVELALESHAGDAAAATAAPGTPATLAAVLHHAGGPLRLAARVTSLTRSALWVSEMRLDLAASR
jgi:hypothetical protein